MTPTGRVLDPTVEVSSHSAGEPFPWRGMTIVAVDVIRSTTTAITAVEQGRRCFVAGSEEEAIRLAAGLPRPLLAGEQRGYLIPGFHMGNSPAAVAGRTDVERPLVLLSSSGTALMAAASGRGQAVLVACLRNVRATVSHLAARGEPVVLIGAETRGDFRAEDQLCCAWIAAGLMEAGFRPTDRTEEIVRRWRGRPPEVIARGASARFMTANGHGEDLRFILEHVDDLNVAFLVRDAEVVSESASDHHAMHAGMAAAPRSMTAP
jgi:2-phosphosulfolactate phosphatase